MKIRSARGAPRFTRFRFFVWDPQRKPESALAQLAARIGGGTGYYTAFLQLRNRNRYGACRAVGRNYGVDLENVAPANGDANRQRGLGQSGTGDSAIEADLDLKTPFDRRRGRRRWSGEM
jgi:hypothetical protein